MDEFLETIKQNLIVNNLLDYREVSVDEIKERCKKLTTLKVDINVPILYLNELSSLKILNIFNMANDPDIKKINYDAINSYKNLEGLIISHNPNIEILDLSNLSNLQNLLIIGNLNLKKIVGLEKLKKLNRVIIVGNDIKNLPFAKQIFENNPNPDMFILDVNLYHNLVNQEININNYSVTFGEKISVGEIYHLNTKMMQDLYAKSIQILSGLIEENMTDTEKVTHIYRYIVRRLRYDFENLNKRNDYIYNHDISVYDNNYKDINSSYKALLDYKVVCEGYANLFKFLLNIENIDVENIVCYINNSNEPFSFYNHTASRVNINGNWLYCDAQIEDDSDNFKYFLQTREEFEKTHKLPKERTKR